MDYDRHDQIVREYFGENYADRAVGVDRDFDSGYIDIVRFFGPSAIDPATVSINHHLRPFVFADSVISSFSAIVEKRMRQEGRLYDGPLVMKLAAADFASPSPSVSVQFATYGQQAGSCFALDLHHGLFAKHGGTLRSYWKSRYRGRRVEENPLAICIGVCGFLISREETILCQHRVSSLASLESSTGPSVAGSVDWDDSYRTLSELAHNSLVHEMGEETGLPEAAYTVTPLAYAREILRGEKPQIFCVIETSLSETEILNALAGLSESHNEHDRRYFIPSPAAGCVAPVDFNHEAKMNYYLLQEWMAIR